mmetsp:Transcript_26356/g.32902  ORF Transcript_26356/g.32902 Transcript_26356/m.32902 type:complete len:95 (+) Transcript_26356:292-576(+)
MYRLVIIMKHPKGENFTQQSLEKFSEEITTLYKAESSMKPKDQIVPEYILCSISGDYMRDPVTLESGRTYERDAILQYFALQKEKAERIQDSLD